MNTTTTSRLRASDLPAVLSADSRIRASVRTTVQIYIFSLMIGGYSKSLTNIALYFGVKISSLSRMLSSALIGEELEISLNRRVRKVIASYINSHKNVTAEIIIDATIIERSSRKAENVGLYHSSGKKVWGHRITNVGLLLDGALYVPLAVLTHHTKAFARASGLSYFTEGMMVCHWLRDHMRGILDFMEHAAIKAEDVTFLLDAGYDNATIQKKIRESGCHFTMMVKNTRSIGGFQVKEFFRRHRDLPWNSVYFNKTTNGKAKRRKFRIRTAENVQLAKVGPVNVVCSEKAGGSSKTNTRRFLISSRLNLSGREILDSYSRRWAIETWHKDMKQNYGLTDCSASKFQSIKNHITLTLIAYLFHIENLKSLPSKGTTIEEYLQYEVRRSSRRTLSLINGKKRLENEMHAYHKEIFSKVA